MTEEGKKHFDLYKFLVFPWGGLVCSPFWYGIFRVIDDFCSQLSFTTSTGTTIGIPWWCSWALFFLGELIIFLFTALYSYSFPNGKSQGHNIYVLISPEYFSDDKYITNDFVESLARHIGNSIRGINIVVPSAIKRETFNRTIAHYHRKHKKYWDSKRWKRLHKKLKGALYFSGTFKRRLSEGKEKYVLTLTATIGYNDVNKDLTPLMIDELQKNFPQNILINKEFELEEFDAISGRFATFSEYLIGWAHLVSGHIDLAYKMHLDIYTNNKQSFFKRGALNDITELLHIELDAILRDGKKYPLAFALSCAKEVEQLFPNSESATLIVPRFLIMISDDDTFDGNLSRAQKLLNKARINKSNRDTVHVNRAYLWLLKGNYAKAEDEYRISFSKKLRPEFLEDVISYCDLQIAGGCSKERPTAYYVKVLMLKHLRGKEHEFRNAIKQAKKSIPASMGYYHSKLDALDFES